MNPTAIVWTSALPALYRRTLTSPQPLPSTDLPLSGNPEPRRENLQPQGLWVGPATSGLQVPQNRSFQLSERVDDF
jgi:hypothetical protein